MEKVKYQYRFIARIVLEAKTPLVIGSGNKDIYTDATIAKDVNGLPYIPGTSIAGVVRHALGLTDKEDNFFGYQKGEKGRGSEIIFSEAKMIGVEGVAIDGIQVLSDDFYKAFDSLPVRQHVRITDKGVGAEHGKFDEEIVYKGTQFCFEIEVLSETDDTNMFKAILGKLYSAEFRIGGGSRKGFGKMEVKSCKSQILDLSNLDDLNRYLNHTADLSIPFEGENFERTSQNSDVTIYELNLEPDDFFLFGAGFGDDEVDLVPVKEKVVDYNKKAVVDVNVLIPASSIKGALAHRVAYHYNRLNNRFADKATQEDVKAWTENNEAVVALFGSADPNNKKRGNVLFEDIVENKTVSEKIFNHVSIDRFTGGAIDGALFSEKATYAKGQSFTTTITLLKNDFEDLKILESFESALNDIVNGMLPLGGATNKGYGCFQGSILKK